MPNTIHPSIMPPTGIKLVWTLGIFWLKTHIRRHYDEENIPPDVRSWSSSGEGNMTRTNGNPCTRYCFHLFADNGHDIIKLVKPLIAKHATNHRGWRRAAGSAAGGAA
jgi:hypothetical protein